LWKRLQKLDRRIDEVDYWMWINSAWNCDYKSFSRIEGMRLKREQLDQQRKEARLKIKGTLK